MCFYHYCKQWTQFQYYTHGDRIRFHRLRSQTCKTDPLTIPFQIPTQSLGCHLCFWLGLPTTPCLVSINLLEQLKELREILHLLDYQFITKYIKGQEWTDASPCGVCSPVRGSILVHSLEALWTTSFGGFVEAHYIGWLIKSLVINDWFNPQPLSPPWSSDGGTECSNPPNTWLVPLATSPHP